MEHEQLHAAVKALDPVPQTAEPPLHLWSAAAALSDIEMRSETSVFPAVSHGPARDPGRWHPALVAAAAFATVLAVGSLLWLATVRGSSPPSEVTTTTQATTTTSLETAQGVDPVPLVTGFGSLKAGVHSLNSFTPPIVFTAETSAFFVQENRSGFFAISAPSSRDPDDRDLVILRLIGLSDPVAPNASMADQGQGWPSDDFDGWLDNLDDGVVVSNRENTTLGGLPATRVDLEIGDIECLPTTPYCVLFDRTQLKPLRPGATYRIWVIDEGVDTPIAIVLGSVGHSSDASWRTAFEQVLSTVEFGPTTP